MLCLLTARLLNAKGVTERTKGRKKTYEEPQREYLFDQLNKHLEKALVDSCKLRRINLPNSHLSTGVETKTSSSGLATERNNE